MFSERYQIRFKFGFLASPPRLTGSRSGIIHAQSCWVVRLLRSLKRNKRGPSWRQFLVNEERHYMIFVTETWLFVWPPPKWHTCFQNHAWTCIAQHSFHHAFLFGLSQVQKGYASRNAPFDTNISRLDLLAEVNGSHHWDELSKKNISESHLIKSWLVPDVHVLSWFHKP